MPKPSKDESKQKIKKPRKWRKRLVLPSLILVLTAALINGPIACWVAKKLLTQELAGLGLSGHVEVRGTLLNGLSLHNAQFRGDRGIQALSVKRASVSYTINDLLDGRLKTIRIKKASIVIDSARFPETNNDEQSHGKLEQVLETTRAWLSPPEIEILYLDVEILKEQEVQAHFKFKSLLHQPGSDDYVIAGFSASDRSGNTTPTQSIALTWSDSILHLDHFEVLPDIAVSELHLDWSSQLAGHGSLSFLGCRLDAEVDTSLKLKLSEGVIDSATVAQRFDLDLPATLTLSALELAVDDWMIPLPDWQCQVMAQIDQASSSAIPYSISKLALSFKQSAQHYELTLDGAIDHSPFKAMVEGSWTQADQAQWWANSHLDYQLTLDTLKEVTNDYFTPPNKIHLDQARVQAEGSLNIVELSLQNATLDATLEGITSDGVSLPDLKLDALIDGLDRAKVKLRFDSSSAEIDYQLTTHDYKASLMLDAPEVEWINALARSFELPVTLHDNLKLSWNGQGKLDPQQKQLPHAGSLSIEHLDAILLDYPRAQLSSKLDYQWPNNVALNALILHSQGWSLDTSASWDQHAILIKHLSLTEAEHEAIKLNGKFPFTQEVSNLDAFLALEQDWQLDIDIPTLDLKQVQRWLKLKELKELEGINGQITSKLSITGSPKAPALDGNIKALNITSSGTEQLAPLDLVANFKTEQQQLNIRATLHEGEQQRASCTLEYPFTPLTWIRAGGQIHEILLDAPVVGKATINTLPIERFTQLIPKLKTIEGTVDATADLTGTLKDPKFTVDTTIKVPLLKLSSGSFTDFRDLELTASIDQDRQLQADLKVTINGGQITGSASADMTRFDDPSFEASLSSNHALIYRDDQLSLRANTELTLKGKIDDATLSGKIGVVESLFYKDLTLIPLGVPHSAAAEVKLPSIKSKLTPLPIPAPFDQWKLDLTLTTDDPILIRGNVADGRIEADIKVKGTLASPELDGKVYAKKVTAKLPFSELNVDNGEIEFKPENGLIPTLEVRGKSRVGDYDISLFVYGSAASPKTAFTSYPPLPENQIMALLATGSTTADLEDSHVATFKAFQIFLRKLKQRADKPGGNKLFQQLLAGVDDLNLKIGEHDGFTGRTFSSATLKLHDRWHLTAQLDDEQQTRGLIVYILRFN